MGDVRLVEEDVDHVSECWRGGKLPSVSGYSLNSTKPLTLTKLNRSANHYGQN